MTKKEFRKLCDSYGPYSEGFNACNLVNELENNGFEFDDLNSHDSVKDWFKNCIDEEYNIGPLITEWYNEGFADYYKIDFSMGTMASITALATADDFYEAFEDRFEVDDEEEEDESLGDYCPFDQECEHAEGCCHAFDVERFADCAETTYGKKN